MRTSQQQSPKTQTLFCANIFAQLSSSRDLRAARNFEEELSPAQVIAAGRSQRADERFDTSLAGHPIGGPRASQEEAIQSSRQHPKILRHGNMNGNTSEPIKPQDIEGSGQTAGSDSHHSEATELGQTAALDMDKDTQPNQMVRYGEIHYRMAPSGRLWFLEVDAPSATLASHSQAIETRDLFRSHLTEPAPPPHQFGTVESAGQKSKALHAVTTSNSDLVRLAAEAQGYETKRIGLYRQRDTSCAKLERSLKDLGRLDSPKPLGISFSSVQSGLQPRPSESLRCRRRPSAEAFPELDVSRPPPNLRPGAVAFSDLEIAQPLPSRRVGAVAFPELDIPRPPSRRGFLRSFPDPDLGIARLPPHRRLDAMDSPDLDVSRLPGHRPLPPEVALDYGFGPRSLFYRRFDYSPDSPKPPNPQNRFGFPESGSGQENIALHRRLCEHGGPSSSGQRSQSDSFIMPGKNEWETQGLDRDGEAGQPKGQRLARAERDEDGNPLW